MKSTLVCLTLGCLVLSCLDGTPVEWSIFLDGWLIRASKSENDSFGKCLLGLFLAGNKRTANLGVKFGFHRGTWGAESQEKYYKKYKDIEDWKTPFEFSSWVYDETQKDVYEFITYLTDRGVSSDIAAKTYRLGSDEMWYPHRKELLSSGILTE